MKIKVMSLDGVTPDLHHATMGISLDLEVDINDYQQGMLLDELREHQSDRWILQHLRDALTEIEWTDLLKKLSPEG